MNVVQFYDDIAEYYDLVFSDWDESMASQGVALANILNEHTGPNIHGVRKRILDVSSGIGTQALALAKLGYDVTARDLSTAAIDRLRREAAKRGLHVDAAAADMRSVSTTVEGQFDAVVSFDNSLPHLQSDLEIAAAMMEFRGLLRPGGALVISVRDYAAIDRAVVSRHPYGERVRPEGKFRLAQSWEWSDPTHYRTTMIVERQVRGQWTEIVNTSATYYAISVSRLLELMAESGFVRSKVCSTHFYQPVLVGRTAT